ncbi:aldo/keto reductase [Streptomonospora sp. PA3]|uniref:aldo/keto reductase n=1 Tax=Streptomonospora sp. PA3 TaxID=2607326 RepID=UPI0012DE57EE|nr:aldo/keto reductase [Streptomonospora sp. PA3]MUL41906.1 aldo/keto reductase [Streptomonospora sp. PA3]
MRYRTIGTGAARRRVSALCLGAMKLGGVMDDSASFAILDRFLEAGGTFIDTANNYRFWEPGCTPDDSEALLGRWRAARGADLPEELVIATKVGARPTVAGGGAESWEGLSRSAVAAAAEGSRRRLGVERIDLYYPHVEDRAVPLEETVDALSELVEAGTVGLLGASNHAAWRLERARGLAEAPGRHRYQVLQLRYSYLQPRADLPLPEAAHVHATRDHLDFVREENAAGRDTAVVAYTPLLMGAYTSADKQLSRAYDHPGTRARLAALDEVAAQTGATRNQVVLSWLIDHDPPIIPLVGVSRTAHVDEAVEAADLRLTADQRRILDEAE